RYDSGEGFQVRMHPAREIRSSMRRCGTALKSVCQRRHRMRRALTERLGQSAKKPKERPMFRAQRKTNRRLAQRVKILPKYDRLAVTRGCDDQRNWEACRRSQACNHARALDRCESTYVAAIIALQRAGHRRLFSIVRSDSVACYGFGTLPF